MQSKRLEFLSNIVVSNVISVFVTCVLLFAVGEAVDAAVVMQMARPLTILSIVTLCLGLLAK